MKRMMWHLLEWAVGLFHQMDGQLALNICKVMTVASIAGFMFSAACLDGDAWVRPLMSTAVCLLSGCFFAVMTVALEEGLE